MRIFFTILLFLTAAKVQSQGLAAYADSLRRAYQIPELAFAVISADEILELQCLGERKINSNIKASVQDRFRIGSNTKTVTGFIAATLVKQNKISWHTKFFDLFPELKSKSNKAYYQLNLLDLLSFRSNLISWTYTNTEPRSSEISGTEPEQRLAFLKWILQQAPRRVAKGGINFSNPGYVAAGMMLEKCSGKNYKELVKALGVQLHVDFDFGPPNLTDSLNQPWGHGESLVPEAPADNFKLSWLLPAGNINVSLPDYCKFIQLQLKGLQGRDSVLNQSEFEYLHYGLPDFSIGWFGALDKNGSKYSYHHGNPGTFLSRVYVHPSQNKAIILFTNSQTAATEQGLEVLYAELKRKMGM